MSDALSTELPWRLSLFHFVRYICAFIHGRVSQRCLLPLWRVWDTFFLPTGNYITIAITLRLLPISLYFFGSIMHLSVLRKSASHRRWQWFTLPPKCMYLNTCTTDQKKKKTIHTPLRLLRFTVSDS